MNNSTSKEITNDKLEEKATLDTNNVETKKEENVVENSTSTEKKEESTTTTENKSVEEKKVEEESKKEETKTEEKTEKEEDKDEIKLTHLNKDFVYEVMKVPTVSSEEYRLVTFIILWARRNGVKYEFDEKGNVYLTKGEVGENEYYPCVTAHLDSVQTNHKPYAQVGWELDVKTSVDATTKKHKIFCDGFGIGGDDKAGVLIGLSMFSHVDKLKACFFLEEEIGCIGSKSLNKEWFKNVGYVMGYDSPDLNRAAWACSGVKLFNKDFFVNHMQEICKEHGLTKFFSEPYTDVKEIRTQTNIICMNFGSGYYNGHMSNEYCIIEDMDNACRMGHALIKHLGNKRYELEHKTSVSTWVNGQYKRDEDESFFNTLGYSYASKGYSAYDDDYEYGYGSCYGSRSYNYGKQSTSGTTATKTTTTKVEKVDESMVNIETVKYITDKYEEYVDDIKAKLKEKCSELNIEFKQFAEIFETKIKF